MAVEFDPAKDAANIAKHGMSLARAGELDIQVVVRDDRREYGEDRFNAFGLIEGIPHCLSLTLRAGRLRAISLRRAHLKEYGRYVF